MDRLIGNRGGIPFVVATQKSSGDASTNAIYTLPNHIFRFLGPVGVIIVTIKNAASDVLGVTVQVNDQSLTLTKNNGEAVTNVEIADYAIVFNKINNTLKVL